MGRDGIRDFERGFGKGKVVELRDSDRYLDKHGVRFGQARKTKTQRIDWLWTNWIPLGGLTFLCGDSGVGKSVLLSALIAIITRGRKFPDGAKARRSQVVYYGIEDSIRAALVPRLKAAGADLDRVSVVEPDYSRTNAHGSLFKGLPEGIAHVADFIHDTGARLVIFDPLADFVASNTDLNDEAGVRHALAPLMRLAEDKELAILCVRHLNKKSEAKALYRILGSSAFAQAPRAIFAVEQDPEREDGRLLLCLKSSYAKKPAPWRFTLTAGRNGVVRVEWQERVEKEAAEAMAEAGEITPGKLQEACEYLERALAHGKADASIVARGARDHGISDKTLYRARKKLSVRSEPHWDEKSGKLKGQWLWLPGKEES
jgi:putative DNA primase/helicase